MPEVSNREKTPGCKVCEDELLKQLESQLVFLERYGTNPLTYHIQKRVRMSYARISGSSDVYVYLDVGGFLRCMWCRLRPRFELAPRGGTMPGNVDFVMRPSMVAHLEEHRAAGHQVPQHAIDTLLDEIRSGKVVVSLDEDDED